jgi:hypothetical protein
MAFAPPAHEDNAASCALHRLHASTSACVVAWSLGQFFEPTGGQLYPPFEPLLFELELEQATAANVLRIKAARPPVRKTPVRIRVCMRILLLDKAHRSRAMDVH